MAELAPSDLPAAVLDRFADNGAAQQAIDTALVAARRFCGWHVSPVKAETIVLDGTGGRTLSLPTLNLLSVTAATDADTVLDPIKLDRSQRRGTLTKRYGRWTHRDGAVSVTITHGFTETEASDWRRAVLAMVDAWSQPTLRDSGDLKRKKVDDVEYEWFESVLSTDAELAARLAQFRILPAP